MDARTARVLLGFLNLNQEQQNDLISEMNEVLRGQKSRSFSINEADRIIRVNTGPLGSTCACCGR